MTDRYTDGYRACREDAAEVADIYDTELRLPGDLKVETKARAFTASLIAKDIRNLPIPSPPASEDARGEIVAERQKLCAYLSGTCVAVENPSRPPCTAENCAVVNFETMLAAAPTPTPTPPPTPDRELLREAVGVLRPFSELLLGRYIENEVDDDWHAVSIKRGWIRRAREFVSKVEGMK